MKTSIKFNRWIKQRKLKIFEQPEAEILSLVLLSAAGVSALVKQEMCTEGRQLIIFKSQALCFEVRLTELDKFKMTKQHIDKVCRDIIKQSYLHPSRLCAIRGGRASPVRRGLTPGKVPKPPQKWDFTWTPPDHHINKDLTLSPHEKQDVIWTEGTRCGKF